MSNKLYLCGITNSDNFPNLNEMIEPIIDYFDGLIWTFHYPKDSGAIYLESRKKNGEIIYANFSQRHGFSMTQFLWQGPMKEGDKFIVLDSSERLSIDFCKNKLSDLISKMDMNNIAMIANYGKGFIFRYNEQLEFRGSPHWYATQLDGFSHNIELSKDDFYSVRAENRDEWHFIKHYLKYYLYPAGSNHCLLGLEKNGNPNELFPKREALRLEFRRELIRRGVDLIPDSVIDLFKKELDNTLKMYIMNEKILNDIYRFYVVGDKNFKDDHDFKNMIQLQ